jgi:hypothetical protein
MVAEVGGQQTPSLRLARLPDFDRLGELYLRHLLLMPEFGVWRRRRRKLGLSPVALRVG